MKLWIALLAVAAVAYAPRTEACACCADHGERRETIDTLDAYSKGELEKVRFAKKTRLYMSAAGSAGIKGMTDPQDSYELTQTRSGDRWTFTLKDPKGKAGTLEFTLPRYIESFFVDQDRKANVETTLYKEWRINAVVTTTGIFAPAASGTPMIRLVLQGRGNMCTDAAQFTHYSIAVSGPTASFRFYGALAAP